MHQSARTLCACVQVVMAALLLLACSVSATRSERPSYFSGLIGTMTTNRWHDTLVPGRVQSADSHLVGAALGWDRQIGDSRFHYGFEAQLAAHFGRQDLLELTVPVVLRYVPQQEMAVRSIAAGLGLSYASEVPQVEIDRNGASQRLFVHWMAELELGLSDPMTSAFVRLHHRSDGYGVFEVDAGSTGFVLGVRHRF